MKLERIPWKEKTRPESKDLKLRLLADGYEPFLWEDPPGARYQPHSHDHDESLWCVEGEITFGVGDEKLRLAPGDRLMLPRGMVHTAEVGPAGAAYWIGQK